MKKIRKEEISGYIDPRLVADAAVLSSMYLRHMSWSPDDYLYNLFKDWFIYYNMNYTEDITITDIICEWQDSVPEDCYTAPKEESEYYYKLHNDIFYSDEELINFLLYCEESSDAKPYNIPKKKKKKKVIVEVEDTEENPQEEEIIL